MTEKLTKLQKAEIKQRFKDGATNEQIATEYNITKRQTQMYAKQAGVGHKHGRPPKEVTVLEEPPEPEPEPVTAVLPVQETEIPVQNAETYLCGSCHTRGQQIQLREGMTFCPSCGVELEWS
jgi:hypothetical protein